MEDFQWSPYEKRVARRAFDRALQAELEAVMVEAKKRSIDTARRRSSGAESSGRLRLAMPAARNPDEIKSEHNLDAGSAKKRFRAIAGLISLSPALERCRTPKSPRTTVVSPLIGSLFPKFETKMYWYQDFFLLFPFWMFPSYIEGLFSALPLFAWWT